MNCPVCGIIVDGIMPVISFTQKYRHNAPWYRCSTCKSYYTTPHESNTEEINHTRKFSYGVKETGVLYNNTKRKLFERITTIILKYFPNSPKVLDHGASFGGFASVANDKGCVVSAIDILPEAIDYLTHKGYIAEVADKITNSISIKNKKFNAVVSIDSCYYWKNIKEEAISVNNILDNEGLFIIRTSDKTWLFNMGLIFNKLFNFSFFLRKSVYDHLSITKLNALLSTLQATGFEIIEVSSLKAIPSSKTSFLAKLHYYIGEFFYRVFRISFSSGFLIVSKKIK